MKTAEFASIIPLIRVWESKLLSRMQYDRLIEAETLEDALKLLQETTYGSFLVSQDFETALNKAALGMYNDIYKATPYEDLVNFIRVKYDYHNLKALIKGKILEKDFSDILIHTGNVDVLELQTVISSGELKTLSRADRDNPKNGDSNGVMIKAIEATLQDYEATKDPQRIDIILDKYMFEHMRQIVASINNDFISKYISTLIDVTNIKTLLRVKRLNKDISFFRELIIDGGKLDRTTLTSLFSESFDGISHRLNSGDYGGLLKDDVQGLEKNIDNYLMNYMKKAKFINLGPEPIVVYMYAREAEIKNIRIILVGKLNKVSENLIRERLRDSYV
jgi:V/A-type H+/Na+-transporting ATPase subunit C